MPVWGYWTDRRRRQLKHDAQEVMQVERRGGCVMWRDDYTLVVSGCEQVSSEQLETLRTLYPRAYVLVSSGSSCSVAGVDGNTFIITVTLLPDTCLAFSGMMLEIATGLTLYGSSLALLLWA